MSEFVTELNLRIVKSKDKRTVWKCILEAKIAQIFALVPIIAVMFTFSFSSAFANISTDEVTALKTYATTLAQGYYGDNGVIAKFAQSYLDKITYDEDGYVFNMDEIKGYVKADTIKAYMADVVDGAEKTFSGKVATIIDGITTTGTITTNAKVQAAVENAYNETITGVVADLTNGDAVGKPLEDTVVKDLVAEQFKAEKTAADAVLAAINPDNYSDSLDEWKFNPSDNTAVQKYGWAAIGLTSGKDYTAKGYVKGILDAQNTAILNAEAVVKAAADDAADAVKDAVDDVRTASKIAKEAILGHKIGNTADENYFIKPIPTIEDLKADTTVETAKANALAQIKAALASKQVAMGQAIQDGINALNKYSKLTDSQKDLLDKLNEQKADLATNFANYEEVATANTNYKTTTAAVNSYRDAVLNEISLFKNNADGTVESFAADTFKAMSTRVKNVKTLKADSELLAAQKDVNGKPYYDAAVLAKNLEKAIEAAYGGTSYDDCYKMLAGGSEAALINAKIEYIKFIKGDDTTNLVPKDSKGYKVTKVWNKATATNTEATITFAPGETWKDGVEAMYDKAQKAELKALVDETKAAIEGAKTIAEVEKIFAEANDKYNDIATTDDHQNAWTNAGKLISAYNKAEYDNDLRAYAAYFFRKADAKVYDKDTYTEDGIMDEVVYPIVYTAYTADELAAKVAEAKAAIDAIKTKEQVKAEKAAVEAAIKALPAASAITVADKDAITAAADLLAAFRKIPGQEETVITNEAVLDAALKAYEAADAKQIKDAYDALKNKDITTADAEAIEALRTLLDAHADFVKDYKVVDTLTATAYETKVVALEDKLSDAKVAEVKAMMIKLPTNPTAAQRAEVEAARAAYEALTLAEKAKIVGELPYQNLIDAEEALDVLSVYAVKGLKLTASSKATKGAITVKWTVKGDAAAADGYQVWKSTKMNKGYKKAFTTTKTTYKNTKGLKKGVKYYYKVRAYIVVDGKNVYSDWSNKAYRTAK